MAGQRDPLTVRDLLRRTGSGSPSIRTGRFAYWSVRPWEQVEGIYLGDFLEIGWDRGPGRKPKTIYCWAIPARRRRRARAELRIQGDLRAQGRAERRSGRGRAWGAAAFEPPPARPRPAIASGTLTELIAREIADLAVWYRADVQAAGSPDASSGTGTGRVEGSPRAEAEFASARRAARVSWAWQPLVGFGIPAVAFVIAVLAR